LNLKNLEIMEYMLDAADLEKISIEPLLFQTGYLTVKEVSYEMDGVYYLLCIPNHEVRNAFNMHVISSFTESGEVQAGQAQRVINEALRAGDLQKMLDMLRALFASIPYQLHLDREAYYHSIFYAVMSVLGFDMDVEVSVSKGRVDAVLELADKVYVMELKYKDCPPDTSAETKRELFEAALASGMEQINARGYSNKYIGSGKTVYQAVFAFLGRDDIEMVAVQL
jgi:hypothetical protein